MALGWKDWLKRGSKLERSSLHASSDFRKKKDGLEQLWGALQTHPDQPARPEPELGPLTRCVAFPLIGPVKAYYLLLFALFVVFVFTKNILVGLLAGATMVLVVVWEFYCGFSTGGLASELKETLYAILIALMVWYGSGWLLATPTPINAIVSCSMLPAYERGDLVILQGGPVKTEYEAYAGPASDVNSSAIVRWGDETLPLKGSLLSHCAQAEAGDALCMRFLSEPRLFFERHGPVEMQYGPCPRRNSQSGEVRTGICVQNTMVNGKRMTFDSGSQLLVYSPMPDDLYASVGDIVHRTRFALNTSSGLLYFTKGDNNPGYDFQAYDENSRRGNRPVRPEQLKGHVIFRLPYLGNFKLFITPSVLTDPHARAQCDSYFVPQPETASP